MSHVCGRPYYDTLVDLGIFDYIDAIVEHPINIVRNKPYPVKCYEIKDGNIDLIKNSDRAFLLYNSDVENSTSYYLGNPEPKFLIRAIILNKDEDGNLYQV